MSPTTPKLEFLVIPLRPVEVKFKALRTVMRVPTIRSREYCNHVISVRPSTMVAQTFVLTQKVLKALPTRKMGEKMIQGVLQEEIGGKDLSIIKSSVAEAVRL